MPLLKDDELKALVDGGAIAGLAIEPGRIDDLDSPIQPSSIDLHIGDLFVPETAEGKRGSYGKPHRNQLILSPGHTAIVATLECVRLPADIGGIGFPPAHVSLDGILMLNPGHVDPGFDGPLHLTLINMGKEPYVLLRGSKILTVLFFQMSGDATASYRVRLAAKAAVEGAGEDAVAEALTLLSRDFLDFDNRAEKVSVRVAKAENLRSSGLQRLWTLLGVLVSFTLSLSLVSGLVAIAYKYAAVEANQRNQEERTSWLKSDNDLRDRVAVLERAIKLLPGASAATLPSNGNRDPGKTGQTK